MRCNGLINYVLHPNNKNELYTAIKVSFDKLWLDYQAVPENMSRVIGVEGNVKNTQISVADTLAYLIGWGKLVLKWHDMSVIGKPFDMPETGFGWNELGKLATHFHQTYADWQYLNLLAEFEQTTKEILTLVDSLTDDELYGYDWYKSYTFGRMIQFNTSSPMKNMRTKVRRFKKLKGIK